MTYFLFFYPRSRVEGQLGFDISAMMMPLVAFNYAIFTEIV